MIWFNFGIWITKSTSMFVWRRILRNGKWTPLIMAEPRYNRRKGFFDTSFPANQNERNKLEKALSFVKHIENHLGELKIKGKVLCKICGKSIDEIYEEGNEKATEEQARQRDG